MRRLLNLSILSLFFLSMACANPFAPTPYQLVNGITVNPAEATLHLGQSQDFSISSRTGRLDELWFNVLGVPVNDPECRCEKSINLGKLERQGNNQLVYHAPLSVSRVSLPVSVEIYVGAGEYGTINSNHLTVAKVTIIP